MGRYTEETGGNFTPAPAGTHIARCYRIVDIGTHTDEYAGKANTRNKVVFFWELPNEMVETDEGMRPALATKFYTNSLNEKATMRADLEAWRGQAFTADELKRFDLSTIIGKPCMLTIVADGDKRKVSSVSGMPKGMACPPQVNPSFSFWLDEWNQAAFDSLSNGMKGLIMASDEYKERTNGHRPSSVDNQSPTKNETGGMDANAARQLALKDAWTKFNTANKAMNPTQIAECWKDSCGRYFPGKTKDQIGAVEWKRFAADNFEKPTSEPPELDPVGTLKEDDIPF